MGNDVTRAGIRKGRIGRGDHQTWLGTQVQEHQPNQATVSSSQEELFPARLARVSEKDYSSSLRKSYMQSTGF